MNKFVRYRATQKIRRCVEVWKDLDAKHRVPDVLYAMTDACSLDPELVKERLETAVSFVGFDPAIVPRRKVKV